MRILFVLALSILTFLSSLCLSYTTINNSFTKANSAIFLTRGSFHIRNSKFRDRCAQCLQIKVQGTHCASIINILLLNLDLKVSKHNSEYVLQLITNRYTGTQKDHSHLFIVLQSKLVYADQWKIHSERVNLRKQQNKAKTTMKHY